jgi:hypothetical protein
MDLNAYGIKGNVESHRGSWMEYVESMPEESITGIRENFNYHLQGITDIYVSLKRWIEGRMRL